MYYRASLPRAAVIARHERLRAAVRFLLWPVVLVVEYPFRARLTFVFSVASLGLMWSKLRRANNRANASPVGGTARSAGTKKSRSNGLGIANGVVSGVKTNTRTQAFRSILRSHIPVLTFGCYPNGLRGATANRAFSCFSSDPLSPQFLRAFDSNNLHESAAFVSQGSGIQRCFSEWTSACNRRNFESFFS